MQWLLSMVFAVAIGATLTVLILYLRRRFPAQCGRSSRLRRRLVAYSVVILMMGGGTWGVTGSMRTGGQAALGALAVSWLTDFALRNVPTGRRPRPLRVGRGVDAPLVGTRSLEHGGVKDVK